MKYPGHPEWTEVFDLTVDPYDIKNLAADAAAVGKLNAELEARLKDARYVVPANVDQPHPPAKRKSP